MIKELITDELIGKINEELQAEREKIDKEWKGKIIDYDDLEDTMICDIFLDYYQIPLMEIDDIIDTRLPFLSELGIDIYPYVGDMDKQYCNISYASFDFSARLSVCFFEVSKWDVMDEEQKLQVRELRNELEELYDELDIDMTMYCQKLSDEDKEDNEDEEDEEDEEYEEYEEDEEKDYDGEGVINIKII